MAQICPRVRILAFGWISFCDRTTVAGRNRSTTERTNGRIAGRGHDRRQLAAHRVRLERLAQRLDEPLQLGRRHRQLALVALAGERAGEGLLPVGRQREDRHEAAFAPCRRADLTGEPGPDMLDDQHGALRHAQRLADRLQDQRQVADRDPLGQQALQHALDAGRGDPAGHQLAEQLLVFGRQLAQQLLGLGIAQQVGQILAHQLGQMGGDDGRRVDHGQALEHGLVAQAGHDPHRRQAERRLGGGLAGQSDRPTLRVHHQQHAGTDVAARRPPSPSGA